MWSGTRSGAAGPEGAGASQPRWELGSRRVEKQQLPAECCCCSLRASCGAVAKVSAAPAARAAARTAQRGQRSRCGVAGSCLCPEPCVGSSFCLKRAANPHQLFTFPCLGTKLSRGGFSALYKLFSGCAGRQRAAGRGGAALAVQHRVPGVRVPVLALGEMKPDTTSQSLPVLFRAAPDPFSSAKRAFCGTVRPCPGAPSGAVPSAGVGGQRVPHVARGGRALRFLAGGGPAGAGHSSRPGGGAPRLGFSVARRPAACDWARAGARSWRDRAGRALPAATG